MQPASLQHAAAPAARTSAESAESASLDASLADALRRIERVALEPLQLITVADRLGAAGRHADVAVLYRRWLERCSSPADYVVQFNLGVTLTALEQFAAAESAYRAAIAQNPKFPQAWFNLGSLVERRERPEEALRIWQSMLDSGLVDGGGPRDLHLLVLNSLGRLLEQTREFQRAESMLRASLELEPLQPKVIQHWVHLRQKQCEWPVYADLPPLSEGEMRKATSPLAMLSASDDPGLQLATALQFARSRVNVRVPALAPAQGYAHPRLRVGFLSSDFCLHAVSLLTVELFELFDREGFELYGFCWTREDGSELRARVMRAMDHFVSIAKLDDAAAAQCIRACEIDVLIDLQGLTSGARPDILALRPAPVQIAYLGFPGTTALPCIDHVIADRYLIPEAEKPYYSESPLYLPDVFQCSDRRRPVGPPPTRAQCGLPPDGFVFCSFNNNYKFTPEGFASWVRIVRRVPGSVLWLLGDNPWAEQNLRVCAGQHGLEPARLILAPRLAPPAYLARYTAADLFLDTHPFNAGTTANDALWMGLPVLTRSGRSFASRMAGSLLTALELPELITTSPAGYEERAVELATQPAAFASLRSRLAEGRLRSPLFDMPRFVRGFEDTLRRAARTTLP